MIHPKEFEDAWEQVKDYTLVDKRRQYALWEAVLHISNKHIPGAIVECGVWKGGSMMLAALALKHLKLFRSIIMYDTFAGMTKPSPCDIAIDGQNGQQFLTKTPLIASLNEVRENMARTGYNPDAFEYIIGDVRITLPEKTPKQIALIHLDTDFYDSTIHELYHLYPLLSQGGVMIVDDYGYWNGSKQAVDEWYNNLEFPRPFMHKIDQYAVQFIKP